MGNGIPLALVLLMGVTTRTSKRMLPWRRAPGSFGGKRATAGASTLTTAISRRAGGAAPPSAAAVEVVNRVTGDRASWQLLLLFHVPSSCDEARRWLPVREHNAVRHFQPSQRRDHGMPPGSSFCYCWSGNMASHYPVGERRCPRNPAWHRRRGVGLLASLPSP